MLGVYVQRARATAQSTVQGKQETNDFDVFLCYNTPDRAAVIEIGERLKEQGILPWLDMWDLRLGFPTQRQLEQQIERIKAAAVFVGKGGVGLGKTCNWFKSRNSCVSRGHCFQTIQWSRIPLLVRNVCCLQIHQREKFASLGLSSDGIPTR